MLDEHDGHPAGQLRGWCRRARPSRRWTARPPARRAAAGRARRPAPGPARPASAPGRAGCPGSGRRTARRRAPRASRHARSRSARSSRSLRGRPEQRGDGSRPGPATPAPAMTFSRTVRPANRPTPCSVRAMPSPASWCGRRPAQRLAAPAQRRPRRARRKPQTTLNSVVLPAPFGPMTPSTSPGSTRRRDRRRGR